MDEEARRKLVDLESVINANFKASVYHDSVLYTLRDAVIDLLAKVNGIPLEQAKSDFESNRRRKHQALLEQMENISPNLAAGADQRKIDDVL